MAMVPKSLLLGVMGDPIAQSKSPAMHVAAMKALGISGTYIPLHVHAEQLTDAVRGLKAMGFTGANVTVPHKVNVIPLLDELDADARAIGAVNTIVHRDGRLVGYNTDGAGYIRSLKEEVASDLTGANVLVLGSGGAARGIIYALLKERPRQIVIANRTREHANRLVDEWQHLGHLIPCGVSIDELGRFAADADIIINTTSVGMYPRTQDSPLPASLIPEGIVVSDLIYNPLHTKLLLEAATKGCRIHGGLGMFVYQGAIAFEHWTGLEAPVSIMREAILAEFGA